MNTYSICYNYRIIVKNNTMYIAFLLCGYTLYYCKYIILYNAICLSYISDVFSQLWFTILDADIDQ